MATNTASVPAPAGPVPFKDVENDVDLQVTTVPRLPPGRSSEEQDDDILVSALPSKLAAGTQLKLRSYQGFWLPERFLPAAGGLQRRFVPRPDDVVIASLPKCGTTWLNALAFATMARGSYPPADADHPLLRLNPHECVPFLDVLFGSGQDARLDALPSPRLMYTHMPHAMLPRAAGGGCRVVYICREPKVVADKFGGTGLTFQ